MRIDWHHHIHSPCSYLKHYYHYNYQKELFARRTVADMMYMILLLIKMVYNKMVGVVAWVLACLWV